MAVRSSFSGSRYAAALLVVLGCLSPVVAEASVAIWTSGDGSRAIVRNASGRPVTIDVPKALPPLNGGTGGATLRASQAVNVGGANLGLTLSRSVTAANLARFARLAVGASMPLTMLGLAYEGIVWVSDHWEKPGAGGGTSVSPAGCWKEYGQSVCYGSIDALCAYRDSLYGGSYNIIPSSSGFTLDGGSKRWDCKNNGVGSSYGTGFLAPVDECAVGEQYTGGQCVAVGTVPATDGEVESSLAAALAADPTKAAPLLENASGFVPIAEAVPGPVVASGPSSVQGPVETTTRQEGGNIYTTINQTTYNLTYSGDTVTVTATTTSTTVDQNSNVVSTTTTRTEAPAGNDPEQSPGSTEDIECGLPGHPPCKIDESGTPTSSATVSAGQAVLTAALDARDAQVTGQTARDSFGWLPTLPTLSPSCSSINVANIFTLDPCPVIEVGRSFFAFLWGFLALIYCWRRVGETVAGGV